MSQQIQGNVKGLASSALRRVHKLFERKLDADELVPYDFAREIYEVATSINRRIGVLVSREGRIEEVVVGSKEILYLPDLGRHRFGQGRLRRLRLIFSDLANPSKPPVIPSDIYTDLEKLRFDAVVSVKFLHNRLPVTYAHLIPQASETITATKTETVADLGTFEFNFLEFIEALENELSETLAPKRRNNKQRVILVGIYQKGQNSSSSMSELEELARTAGVEVVDKIVQHRDADPRTLIGKGKLEEVVLRCLRLEAEMIIFDTELKPTQWRSITNLTELKVLDRSMLILDIFAQRATSSDGRIQVELAQLKYNLPRLVEKDSGLSRLSGGIGGRGPGETKLEVSRRRIRDRIANLEKQIEKLGEQRGLRRQRRQDRSAPLVAILGYTNVGKSTLFNALTKSTVLAEDKLFATLDPAQRRIVYTEVSPEGVATTREMVFSDTVGFIRDLPKELSSAFRATLEELSEATLLLHVLDASDPDILRRKASVDEVLEGMGLKDIPTIIVLNKTDKLPEEQVAELATNLNAIALSAVQRRNLSGLMDRVLIQLFHTETNQAETPLAEGKFF